MRDDEHQTDDVPDLPDSAELTESSPSPEIPELPDDVLAVVPVPLPLEPAPTDDECVDLIEELEPLVQDSTETVRTALPAAVEATGPEAREAKPAVALSPSAPIDDENPPLRELDQAPAHLRTAAILVVIGASMPFMRATKMSDDGSVWFSLAGKGVILIAAWVWCQQVLHNFGPKRSGLIGMLADLVLVPKKAEAPEDKPRKSRKAAGPAKQNHPFPTGLHLISAVLIVLAVALGLKDPRGSMVDHLGPGEVAVFGWGAFTYVHIIAYQRWCNFNPLFPLMFLGMLIAGIASVLGGLGAEGVWKIFGMTGGVIIAGGGGLAAYTIVEAMIAAKKEGDLKKAEASEARKAARRSRR